MLNEDGILGFRGIPYGGDMGGANRFRAPVDPEPWTETRDVSRTGPRAVQAPGNLFQTYVGDYFAGGKIGELGLNDQKDSEACLVLNVLTPALEGSRPVLVYIHGGGFREGSGVIGVGSYGLPRDEDVVLVSVNHRLNVFGYLHLADLDAAYAGSGNAGNLDLLKALEWVRDNIANFGGDPSRVTIFGESGGGRKITTLLGMPKAAGLFHRAIVMSGSRGIMGTAEQGTANARTVLERLGIAEDNLSALADVSTQALWEAGLGLDWGSVVDGDILPKHPYDPEAPEASANIPLMVGGDEDEERWLMGSANDALFYLTEEEAREQLPAVMNGKFKAVVGYDLDAAKVDPLIDLYRAKFLDDNWSDTFFRLATDAGMALSTQLMVERKVKQGSAPVWKYVSTFDSPINEYKYGAFHTAELPLILRLAMYPESEELSRKLAAAFAAFARNGDPSAPGLTWPAYTLEDRATAIFDKKTQIVDDPWDAQRVAWAGALRT